jgi:hypothetical protein
MERMGIVFNSKPCLAHETKSHAHLVDVGKFHANIYNIIMHCEDPNWLSVVFCYAAIARDYGPSGFLTTWNIMKRCMHILCQIMTLFCKLFELSTDREYSAFVVVSESTGITNSMRSLLMLTQSTAHTAGTIGQ